MRLPPFLLLDDSTSDVQAFTAMIKRIGLVNAVHPVGTLARAQDVLLMAQQAMLPVVVFSGGTVGADAADELFMWMQAQAPPLSGIPTVSLTKPLEMYAIIGALKALALPERARIDTTTLMVRVELWPHGTILHDA